MVQKYLYNYIYCAIPYIFFKPPQVLVTNLKFCLMIFYRNIQTNDRSYIVYDRSEAVPLT